MTLTRFLLASLVGISTASAHEDHGNRAAGKVVTTVVRTGNGTQVYETVPNWGALPEGKNLGPTHGGVAVDKAGNVYVSTEAEHAVVVFKSDGTYLKSIAPDCQALHALSIVEENGTEFLYGAHLGGQRVVKLDLDGRIVLEIPNKNTGTIPKGFKGLTAVAVANDGSIFAGCGYGSNLIHKFDASGKILKTVGGRGISGEKGKFRTCHGLALDLRNENQPLLLVCDRENRRLVHLDLELNWVGVHSTGLRRPCAVSILGPHTAVAELEGRVTVLDRQGVPVSFLGDNPDKKDWAKKPIPEARLYDGLFTSPHGLSYDTAGNLYVQDWNVTGRITMLKKTAN